MRFPQRSGWALKSIVLTLACASALGQDPESAPRAVVAEDVIDLGTLQQGEHGLAVFLIRNEGNADLVIHSIKESCGCTVADLPEERRRIAPGEEVQIPVNFDSHERAGNQEPKLQVSTNDPRRGIVELTVKSYVHASYVVEPSKVLPFQNGRRGKELTRKLRIHPTDPEMTLEVLSLSMADSAIRVAIAPTVEPERRGQVLTFSIADDAPLGDVNTSGTARLRVGDEEVETVLSVHGLIVGDLSYRPTQLAVLKKVKRGQELNPVTVASVDDKPFKVLKADAGPCLTTSVEPKNELGTQYKVTVRVAPDCPAGPLAATLAITTDTVEHPRIEIPVFVSVPRAVEVDPLLVRLAPGPTRIERERRVILENTAGEPLELLGAECDLSFVRVEIIPQHEGRDHLRRILLSLDESVPAGDHQGALTIKTSATGANELQIPVEVSAYE